MQKIRMSFTESSSLDRSGAAWTIKKFEYPIFEPNLIEQDSAAFGKEVVEAWEPGVIPDEAKDIFPEGEVAASKDDPLSSSAATEALLSEVRQQGYEAGHKQGYEEGRLAAEEEAHTALMERSRSVDEMRKSEFVKLAQNFDEACERYSHTMEPEVVRLALAVAARILRREAQMDPLLLTGAVRVALGQISASSKVRLKVPSNDLQLWKEAIAHLPKLSVRPEVFPGENMRLGDCIIETELGSVDLGVRAQLSEIERGFFDRPNALTVPSSASVETANEASA